ncbi:DNA polymerase IV [Shinella sumterensis]|uniref:DNA polymerase IV n=1 Tax=Shinella sumterensis TaxID=1967501 RepID=A0AA50CU20_9HYPH|nr:DNA polymerase IV [Shinella sumterensis]WLS00615.1 DNA polymerase IV [Shinella sumterensis]
MQPVTSTEIKDEEPDREERVRRIIHVDMDSYYASVEQRDHPELRGKPVAVGSPSARGVVLTASYEARPFGVRSALPSLTAKRLCPDLIFVPARFDVYRSVSAQIHAIFAEYTDLIEPLSLDEAYLDVTHNKQGVPIATEIATRIRARIKEVTGLNASAGISYCKFLAKMASDLNKPNGQAVITPKHGPAFVARLAVKKFHGIGPATATKMERLGILTGADLRAKSLAFLQQHFGKSGTWYYNISRGIDDRPVRPDRERKSVGAEDTFIGDIFDLDAARGEILPLVDKVWRHCHNKSLRGRTVTLKVKYTDFQIITRSRTEAAPFETTEGIVAAVDALLAPLFPAAKGIRLLGITLSAFTDDVRSERADQLQLAI